MTEKLEYELIDSLVSSKLQMQILDSEQAATD